MATKSSPTANQRARAQMHLSRREQWRYVRNRQTGVAFIVMPSSDGTRVYQVHPEARGCSCQAYQRGGYAMCSHMLAVAQAHQEDRNAYRDGLPTCQAPHCSQIVDPDQHSCARHALIDAF